MRTVLKSHRTRYAIWLFTAFVAILVGAFCLLTEHNLQTASAQWTFTNVSQAIPTAIPASIPSCTPLAFTTPYQINLGGASAGLHVQADAPSQYQIYGNTVGDLSTQIQQCAPDANGSTSAEFTGQTEYSLDWQYAIVANDTGCSLTDVKVGLHTAIVLPYWQTPNGATTGLAGRWQAFMNGLTTHEQGHVALDKTYASRVLADLNSLGTQSCDTIDTSAKAIATSGVSALNQANDSYDTATGHGVSQGAVLPAY